MTSFLDPVIAFVSAHPWLAYLTLFLAALLEAVPVVGALVPGSTIILALSALVPGGELKLWGVLAAAIAGAVLGDGSAFWAGHRSQREILGAWPMSRYPAVMAQSEAFFQRWGTLAVLFARFVPPIRAFVPVTAGALGMPPILFFGVNIPAVLAWALAHVLPGVLAVSALHEYAGLPHHQHTGKHLWMLAVFAAAIIALGVWTLRRRQARTGAAPRCRTDIARTGPDQPAMPQLFAGMRDPPHRARHGKQHQFMAGRQAERVHQHRKGIVDIDELAGRFGDAVRDFVGEFAIRARARQRFQQRPRAGIAMLVDAMTKAREAFAERDALADDGGDLAIGERLQKLRRQHAGAAVLRAFQRHQTGDDRIVEILSRSKPRSEP